MQDVAVIAGKEDGAVAAVTAIVLTVLLALMAFVVDYGLVRADIRHSQSAGDAAAVAGVGALADDPGNYEGACQAAVAYLEANLGITISAGLCAPFASGSFEAGGVTCADRGDADADLAPSTNPGDDPPRPVYVEDDPGSYTIRIQMPVRDVDQQMSQQDIDEFDGVDPCKRMAVSVSRSRSTIFGVFAGNGDEVSGFADAVSVYEEGDDSEDVPSLIILDQTGCRVLQVSSSGGALIVENLDTTDAEGNPVIYPGVITADSNGADCSPTASSDYVMRTNASAKLCAGVDIVDDADFAALVAGDRDCESDPDTLRSPSWFENNDGTTKPYGQAAHESQVTEFGTTPEKNINPEPIPGPVITRERADHEWNCRSTYPLAGEQWWPHYEMTNDPCDGRAANMDELLLDLKSGTPTWAKDDDGTPWLTVADCNPLADVGDGTTNIFLSCPGRLRITSDITINPKQYIVVSGWVDVTTDSGILRVKSQEGAGPERDVVMVVRDRKSGTGEGFMVGSQSDLYMTRTMLYLDKGALAVNAVEAIWSAPDTNAYDDPATDTMEPQNCIEQQSFGGGTVKLPSPECFQNLALWGNSHDSHMLRGGAELDVEGVFFTPYAGRSGGAFDLSGGVSTRLTKAQFFTYRFDMSGSSTLSLRPDPSRNLKVRTTSVGLIR